MGSPGLATTTAPGLEQDQILDIQASVLGQNLKVMLNPVGEYRDKYYAFWLNGAYVGANTWIPAGSNPVEACFSIGADSEIAGIFVNDAGGWPDYSDSEAFPDGIFPGGPADWEAATAHRLLFSWTPNYVLTAIQGDTQLSSVVVTNPARGVNLSPGSLPTRGDLTYSIATVSGVHTISWYAGSRLVAQGQITGNGAFSCPQQTGSMLSVTGVLTYTGDLSAGIATLEVCWPAQYYVYYSTSPIVIPSTPQYIVPDQNAIKYLYLSPTLGGSTYYYTVLTVDDQNNVQTTGYPTPAPLVINDAPPPVTNLFATGTAAACTINWTPGEPMDEFRVYYSLINEPVNFGEYILPANIWRDFNTTSCTLPPITGYASVDRTSYITTMQGVMDVQVANVLTAYNSGESGFAATVTNALAAMESAAITYGQQISANVYPLLESLNGQTQLLLANEVYLATLSLSKPDWQAQTYLQLSNWIAYVGSALYGTYTTFLMPDGQPGPQSAGYQGDNLTSMCDPIILPGTLRVVVRAQNAGGIQEHSDQQLNITFDDAGNIVGSMPNNARITGISPTALQVAVSFEVVDDNAVAIPDTLNLYAGPIGTVFDPNVPQATVPMTAPSGFNLQSGVISWTAPGTGTYQFAVAAVASGTIGTLSPLSYIYLGTSQQITVGNLIVAVQNGK